MGEAGARMIVAADVGGTKTDVGLFDAGAAKSPVRTGRYRSTEHAGLEEVLADFLGDVRPVAAGVAAAGPVRGGVIRTTNLPWVISGETLTRELGGVPVRLLNDLEAAAAGVLTLDDDSFETLNPGAAQAERNRAVLAPGTGLGQSILMWTGHEYRASATEGGHVGFAPRDEEQIALLRFAQRTHANVSYEHLASGMGLSRIFAFVTDELKVPAAAEVAGRIGGQNEDDGAVIGDAAVAGRCEASLRTVEIFFSVLAARAGDLTLSVMATGGLYLCGGIVPKLLPVLDRARFRSDFAGEGPFADLLADVPVLLVLEPQVALIGAAAVALSDLGAS